METFVFVLNLALVFLQGGIPSNPYPPIEGSLSPGATHRTSGDRWETTLTVKDMDTWLGPTGTPTIVCNPNSYVVPVSLPSHEPTAAAIWTTAGFVNCTWTFIHSKVARIRPPGSPEEVFIDRYLFTDNNPEGPGGAEGVTDDDDLELTQQVWIKGAPPAPPPPPGGGG